MKDHFLKKYEKASEEERIDIICKNYGNFLGMINSFTEGIVYLIEEEQEYNRKKEMGDLGVAIRQTGTHSDKTAATAIKRVSVREAVISCDFKDGLLDGSEHEEEIINDAFLLRKMKRDYELFTSQIMILEKEEAELLKSFLLKEKDLYEISGELKIQYDSAQQKVGRIRKRVKENTLRFSKNMFYGREGA